jgi:cytochrome c-type biogenesis protein CcmH/NrfG
LKKWMAGQSRDLFERALLIDSSNDSLAVGLGATYIFGGGSEDPASVMKGIQQILEVTRKDSANMYAQFMLGLGGIESGQFDKAVVRLSRVVAHEPHNLEAVLSLAEAFERENDRASASKWYGNARKMTNNPELIKAIEERIGALK